MLKKIEDYQLRELEENKLYINIYDLSLKYDYELKANWKELFFDILEALAWNDYVFNLEFLEGNSLFVYMKKRYKQIIEEYNLNIDIRDYLDITDYISLDDWRGDPDNGIAYFRDEIYLIKK